MHTCVWTFGPHPVSKEGGSYLKRPVTSRSEEGRSGVPGPLNVYVGWYGRVDLRSLPRDPDGQISV